MSNYHKASGLITLGLILFFGAAVQNLWGILAGLGAGITIHGAIWLLAIAMDS